MSDDNDVPIDRRSFPTTAVLEWRVTQLEHQAERMNTLMIENKNEILAVIKDHNAAITNRLDEITKGNGVRLDRVILAIAALGSLVGAVGVFHK